MGIAVELSKIGKAFKRFAEKGFVIGHLNRIDQFCRFAQSPIRLIDQFCHAFFRGSPSEAGDIEPT